MAGDVRLIVLAAGQGTRMRPLTDDLPKCLVRVVGRPLLSWHLDAATAVGIDEVVVVGGHCADRLEDFPVTLVRNEAYASTNMVESLLVAWPWLEHGAVVTYGDIAFRPAILRAVADARRDIAVVVDRTWLPYWQQRFDDPLDDAESLRLGDDGRITSIGQRAGTTEEIEAQYIGLFAVTAAGAGEVRDTYERLVVDHPRGRRLFMTDVLHALATAGRVHAVPVDGGWIEVDSLRDLEVAESLVAAGRLADHGGGVA